MPDQRGEHKMESWEKDSSKLLPKWKHLPPLLAVQKVQWQRRSQELPDNMLSFFYWRSEASRGHTSCQLIRENNWTTLLTLWWWRRISLAFRWIWQFNLDGKRFFFFFSVLADERFPFQRFSTFSLMIFALSSICMSQFPEMKFYLLEAPKTRNGRVGILNQLLTGFACRKLNQISDIKKSQ